MKICISNWGPIQHCEYDLNKSLIVTYGENNIGKSYAMQVLYLVIKYLIEYAQDSVRFYSYYSRGYGRRATYSPIEKLIMQFNESEKSEQDITEQIIEMVSNRFEESFLPELDEALERTFGVYSILKDGNPTVTIKFENSWEIVLDIGNSKVRLTKSIKKIYLKKSDSDFHKSRECKTRLNIYVVDSRIEAPVQLIESQVLLLQKDLASLILSQVREVYFLPASRSGIYAGMNSFGPIVAELSQKRTNIRRSIQIPSLSEPISDYYAALSSVRTENKNDFSDIAREIETMILKGSVTFDMKSKNLLYTGEEMQIGLEMSDVSSMIAEIAPITAFLKYIIGGRLIGMRKSDKYIADNVSSVIFIEEPEAHLHPVNQIKLSKIFAKLVKKNVKLVLASHSNYIFNEFNNLVIGKMLDAGEYEPILMTMECGKTVSSLMSLDELGVDDENFADVADAIYEEREELIIKYMQEMNCKQDDKADCE